MLDTKQRINGLKDLEWHFLKITNAGAVPNNGRAGFEFHLSSGRNCVKAPNLRTAKVICTTQLTTKQQRHEYRAIAGSSS